MMADDFFCMVNEYRVSKLDVYAPWSGAWYADVVLDDGDVTLAGRVTITVGTLKLAGTIEAATSGAFVMQRHFRVVAGAGQWGKRIGPENYYMAPSVSRQAIATDLARETGETLAAALEFPPDDLGPHFVRRAGLASLALERLVDSPRVWWVDQAGITQIGTRTLDVAEAGKYQTLSFSPATRTAEIALDDPAVLWVGSLISDRFDAPKTIRDLELHADGRVCRVRAFVDDASESTRLSHAFDALLETTAQRFYGTYRYQVFSDPNDNTLNLQVVRPVSGLPDVLPVSIAAGLAGGRTHLKAGEIVRVAFDEGDPTMPFVAHYPPGAVDASAGIARMADLIMSGGGGTTVTFGLPCTGGAPLPPTPAVVGSPVIIPGVPYLVSFGGAIVPPTPPVFAAGVGTADPLMGFVLTASTRNETE